MDTHDTYSNVGTLEASYRKPVLFALNEPGPPASSDIVIRQDPRGCNRLAANVMDSTYIHATLSRR